MLFLRDEPLQAETTVSQGGMQDWAEITSEIQFSNILLQGEETFNLCSSFLKVFILFPASHSYSFLIPSFPPILYTSRFYSSFPLLNLSALHFISFKVSINYFLINSSILKTLKFRVMLLSVLFRPFWIQCPNTEPISSPLLKTFQSMEFNGQKHSFCVS